MGNSPLKSSIVKKRAFKWTEPNLVPSRCISMLTPYLVRLFNKASYPIEIAKAPYLRLMTP